MPQYEKKYYKIKVTCSNCDEKSEVSLERGKPADGLLECPNCGCKKARKLSPSTHPIYNPPYWTLPYNGLPGITWTTTTNPRPPGDDDVTGTVTPRN